jgi:hypothetical protein
MEYGWGFGAKLAELVGRSMRGERAVVERFLAENGADPAIHHRVLCRVAGLPDLYFLMPQADVPAEGAPYPTRDEAMARYPYVELPGRGGHD